MSRPTAIFSSAQVRALDAFEIEQRQVPSFTLMTRAAVEALRLLRQRWPTAHRLAVVCGGGNNGGDGYVLARLARAEGLEVRVIAAAPTDSLRGDARRARQEWTAAGGDCIEAATLDDRSLADADLVVDALLGTGFAGPLRPLTARLTQAMNATGLPILALDVPSGLDAGSGVAAEATVRARVTVTFVGLKAGLFLGAGPAHAGEVVLADLGVVPPASPEFSPLMWRSEVSELSANLPPRARDAHKGSHGRVLIVGGGPGMPGALRLAGEAALRVGAGLVTVAGAPENLLPVMGTRPELIYLPTRTVTDLTAALAAASVIAIGPGLGQSEWSRALWNQVLGVTDRPVVLDADALNLLAAAPRKLPANWILTPHPGEAARLLGRDTPAVQADRAGAVRELHQRYGAVVVLKGAGTLVAGDGDGATQVFLCDRGNPGMATAGMGDVLTGVIAGLLAQWQDSVRAARLGVLVHALAGDRAALRGERGLLASDVIAELRAGVNPDPAA